MSQCFTTCHKMRYTNCYMQLTTSLHKNGGHQSAAVLHRSSGRSDSRRREGARGNVLVPAIQCNNSLCYLIPLHHRVMLHILLRLIIKSRHSPPPSPNLCHHHHLGTLCPQRILLFTSSYSDMLCWLGAFYFWEIQTDESIQNSEPLNKSDHSPPAPLSAPLSW